jgi:hypothetical protein
VVLEVEALDPRMRRQRVDALLAPRAEELDRVDSSLGLSNFGMGEGSMT